MADRREVPSILKSLVISAQDILFSHIRGWEIKSDVISDFLFVPCVVAVGSIAIGQANGGW